MFLLLHTFMYLFSCIFFDNIFFRENSAKVVPTHLQERMVKERILSFGPNDTFFDVVGIHGTGKKMLGPKIPATAPSSAVCSFFFWI